MKREPGFYWIKVTDVWVVGRFNNGLWTLAGTDIQFLDKELTEITVKPLKYKE